LAHNKEAFRANGTLVFGGKQMKHQPIIGDSAVITPRDVLAEKITILLDHSQTGSYEIYLHDAPEDVGPPPHSHPWDEAFYVIRGQVHFMCGDVAKTMGPGGFVHVPAGTVHSFRYGTCAQILGVTSTAGAATMFTAVDRECSGPPDFAKIAAVLNSCQVTLAPPGG
jgi:mannose-6-phosphate isomerase-like protein (cupin superfamily)